MTWHYLVGELSVRLERLQAVTSADCIPQVASLRHEVESCPMNRLGTAVARALVLADGMCWDSLSAGDLDLFARQADVSAELRQFGICSKLVADDLLAGDQALR